MVVYKRVYYYETSTKCERILNNPSQKNKREVERMEENTNNQNNNNTSTSVTGAGDKSNTQNQGASNDGNNGHKTQETTQEKTLSEFLKQSGIDSEEQLGEIIKKNKELEESQKTELQKSNDNVDKLVKELAEERRGKIIADAKLLAMTEGADKDLIDDLVIVVMSKVTQDKGVSEVIKEIKESPSGKVYFPTIDSEGLEKEKRRNITGGAPSNNSSTSGSASGNNEGNTNAPIASRLFAGANKNKSKGHFFKN